MDAEQRAKLARVAKWLELSSWESAEVEPAVLRDFLVSVSDRPSQLRDACLELGFLEFRKSETRGHFGGFNVGRYVSAEGGDVNKLPTIGPNTVWTEPAVFLINRDAIADWLAQSDPENRKSGKRNTSLGSHDCVLRSVVQAQATATEFGTDAAASTG